MTDKVGAFNPSGHFDQLSSKYDDLIGLLTGDIGRFALDSLIPNPISDSVIHDNACGTGVVTEHLQHIAFKQGSYPKIIHATDFVPSVTQVIQELTFPDTYFDLSITNFGIFFLSNPQKGVDHIYRTLKPGGIAVVTAWKERQMMETIIEAQKVIRPDLKYLHSPWAKSWSREETLRNILLHAGFHAENVKVFEKRTDAAVEPFLKNPDMVARAYPAATEGWSEEERASLGDKMLSIARDKDPEGGGAGGLCSVAYIAIAKK